MSKSGDTMRGCGAKNDQGDICGETYTCGTCKAADASDLYDQRIEARIQDLEDVVSLLTYHVRRWQKDPEAISELDNETRGTAMQ